MKPKTPPPSRLTTADIPVRYPVKVKRKTKKK